VGGTFWFERLRDLTDQIFPKSGGQLLNPREHEAVHAALTEFAAYRAKLPAQKREKNKDWRIVSYAKQFGYLSD
jgi:hypothetical protein